MFKPFKSNLPYYAILFLSLIFIQHTAYPDEVFPYSIELVPITIPEMPGLHSFSYGQHDDLWILIGGRLDGLHARQPGRSFPASSNNTTLFVVDPESRIFWEQSVTGLPTPLSDQLQSTNMNFYQDGQFLYIMGGYGYSAAAGNHITHPYVSIIDVPGIIAAIQNKEPVDRHIHQFHSNDYAVTGGQLGKIGQELFLVGGHRFDGRYHHMDMGSFSQEYTNAIRVFTLWNPDTQVNIELVREYTNPEHLRRRDYNLVPQYWPDGGHGYLISSGVFQRNADLPFLYPIEIRANGYTPVSHFEQLLSHYHSAKLPLYDNATRHMHSLFFGGIAQYYFQGSTLVRDDLVPFVNTISRVSRAPDGTYTEYLVPQQMPGLIGASGEFIPNPKLLHNGTRVIHTKDLSDGPTLVGHIVGGIRSPEQNPFSSNRTHLTAADSSVYAVLITPNPVTHTPVPNKSTARK